MRKASAALGSLVFLLVAPGIVAGFLPWWLTHWESRIAGAGWLAVQALGIALIGAGTAVLLHSFVRFVVEGLGTPAPVAPPDRLVVGGLYRHVRNPMYVANIAIVLGQALLLGQTVLLPYTAGVAAAMIAFVRWYEEPALRRRFGADYEAYRQAVPAWWPRLRPWKPESGATPHREK